MRKKHSKTGRRTFKAGFSLGEVLLSVAVLTVGILPVLASITRVIKVSNDNQRIIIASGLAQEGIELVQNIRDNRFLSNPPDAFSGWLPPSGTSWYNCRIDFKSSVVMDPSANQIACDGSSAVGSTSYDLTPVSGGTNSGMYGLGGVKGQYKRRLYLTYDSTKKQLSVISAVYWGTFSSLSTPPTVSTCIASKQCVFAEATLTAWR